MSRLFRTGRQLGFLVGEQKEDEDVGIVVKARSWPDEFVSPGELRSMFPGWIGVKTGYDRKIAGYFSALDTSFVLERPAQSTIKMPKDTTVDNLLLQGFVNKAKEAFVAFHALYGDIIVSLIQDRTNTWEIVGTVCTSILEIAFSQAINVVEKHITENDIRLIAGSVAAHISDSSIKPIPLILYSKLETTNKEITDMKGVAQEVVEKMRDSLNSKLSIFDTSKFVTSFTDLAKKLSVMIIFERALTGHALRINHKVIGKIVPFQNLVHHNLGESSAPLAELALCMILYPPCTLVEKTKDEKTVNVFPFSPKEWESAFLYNRALVIPCNSKDLSVRSMLPKKLFTITDDAQDILKFLKTFDTKTQKAVNDKPHHLRTRTYISAYSLYQYSRGKVTAKDVLKDTHRIMRLYPLISFDERTIVFPFYKPLNTFLVTVELKTSANTTSAKVHLHFCYLCGDDLYEPDQIRKLELNMVYRLILLVGAHTLCVKYQTEDYHNSTKCEGCKEATNRANLVIKELLKYKKDTNEEQWSKVSRTFAVKPGKYNDCADVVIF